MEPTKTLNTKYIAQVVIIIFLGKLFMYSVLFQSNPMGKNDSSFSRNAKQHIFKRLDCKREYSRCAEQHQCQK